MPIIPQVGRKAFSIRLLIATIYIVLTLGAVTMVYPFLLMLATSITSSTDTNEFRILPRYLTRFDALFAKYTDDKYSGDIEQINMLYHTDFKKNEEIQPPAAPADARMQAFVAEWRRCLQTLPLSFQEPAFRGYGSHPSQFALSYRQFVRNRFQYDILALNRAYIEENTSFDTVSPPLERPTNRNWSPDRSRKMQEYLEWKRTLPAERRLAVGVEPLFAKYLREDSPQYGGDIRRVAQVWGSRIRSFSDITLPGEPPDDPLQRRDWEGFVRNKLPFRYILTAPEAVRPYRAYLQRRYRAIEKLNAAYGANYPNFEAVPLPYDAMRRAQGLPQPASELSDVPPERPSLPEGGPLTLDWGDFLAREIPLSMLYVDSPENRFRYQLWRKHVPDPARFNFWGGRWMEQPLPDSLRETYGLQAASLMEIKPPYYYADALYVQENAGSLRRDFVTRNYRLVLDYIALHGRALWVTAIFCIAVISTTLIVNPFCAYALSRYSLPYAFKVLLFLLATMAFPAEVAMIPNFLLLKEFNLLNTFWALVLPGMASGFSIFLLKGFFDSLPKELYEAGLIDGASEMRMFFNVALPLSKPIFAVIALQAFTAAYGAFMFAFLVCQDPKMWTLMVWLYELQINSPQYITMAALTVAALPTLFVFIFAQNVIMRGIILPSYK